jgi:2-oxo-4-hydroxy-4-carboxy-5-ureidoimidazoline decarboxylase
MPTLGELNALAPAGARDFFFSVCGSSRWADALAACRPFWDVNVVFNAADVVWEYLSDEDRREALRNRQGVDPEEMPQSLREDLEYYRSKFGYGFVSVGPVPPPDELQTVVRRRLEYPAKAEFELASAAELAMMRSELRKRIAG